ncbi:erythromycin esterase [Rhodococcus wratislaviensis]|uniref:Erythromycin esterase n=1 Tax=Rhodococcus wratislaviensis TaxID=44752 RepID=A0AB38FIT6_RHOWR|nr:erythromycin esterase family protein [Rhodococcus wratislaviensis]REE73757.1 erythromycin esterase [Rhodococcus wratislaviensis]SPZ41618.1 erythromycin esterase [Rhodococcus wratislaviensis]
MTVQATVRDVGAVFSAPGDPSVTAALGAFLRRLDPAPRLLGFGEPMHGEESFLLLRNQMFRFLVEHEGYRSIAIESSCLKGLLVDSFVRGADRRPLDDVMERGFSHGFGESRANRDLIGWMAEYNRRREPDEQLRFSGFDAPIEMTSADSPRQALTFLDTYLRTHLDEQDLPCAPGRISALIGDDDRWRNPAVAMDPTQAVGTTPEAVELRLIADDLMTLLASQTPRLVADGTRDEVWEAELHGRVATCLLSYHAGMAENSPRRIARLLGIRDTLMADNLSALVEREADRGPTFVFAHNGHLSKGETHWDLAGLHLHWWCAGAHLDVRLGDAYTVIGSAVGEAPGHGIGQPPPGTLEDRLFAVGESCLVPAAPVARRIGDVEKRADPSGNSTYFPLDPAGVGELDGILFVRHIDDAGT